MHNGKSHFVRGEREIVYQKTIADLNFESYIFTINGFTIGMVTVTYGS